MNASILLGYPEAKRRASALPTTYRRPRHRHGVGRFQGDTLLFETDTWFLLRDAALTFGFERYNFTFPPVEPFFQQPSDNHVLASRAQLGAYLANLQSVSADRDSLVAIRVSGFGNGQMELSVLEAMGKPCRCRSGSGWNLKVA
jgi:hypothetical protein